MTASTADIVLTAASGLSLALWVTLAFFRHRFWRADQRLTDDVTCFDWPSVTAVIPARNEADVLEESLTSLLEQDYPGDFDIILVDDGSEDSTGDVARDIARSAIAHGGNRHLGVIRATPLPAGWAGKMWAVHQGLETDRTAGGDSRYLLLTDADIRHAPDNLRKLVAKAEAEKLDLVSLMVRLHCRSVWDWLLIPAFVFFFQKLYPFAAVNDPENATAGAAGGCMLVRRDALDRIDGVETIKSEIIDDCALARAVKKNGPIWLGLTENTASIRAYETLPAIWRMVARSAFDQLDYSALNLIGTVIGMALLYLMPPVAMQLGLLWDATPAVLLAGAAWLTMAGLMVPTLRLYRISPVYGLLLPIAGLLYGLMTLDSARRHWLNKGGAWKGRTYS
jgi:hopene-associated glycosyltransferase HpnB